MGLARLRATTLLIASLTLLSNTLSSLLFAQLPDEPYHLATYYGWYLHFANILSVFGFIGALRQHPLSISLFSTSLLLDTTLSTLTRLLLLPLTTLFCSPSALPPQSASQSLGTTVFFSTQTAYEPLEPFDKRTWNEESCYRVVGIAQLAMAAAVVGAGVLQGVGAMVVREYARGVWGREVSEDAEFEVGDGERGRGGRYEDLENGRVKC